MHTRSVVVAVLAAAAGYRRKIAFSPNDGEAPRRLGVALMEMNQYAESLPQLEEAWKLSRRGPRDTAHPAARAAAAAGDLPKTIEWLRAMFENPLSPGSLRAANGCRVRARAQRSSVR